MQSSQQKLLLNYRYLCGIYIPLALNLKPKRIEYPSTLAGMYDCAVEDRQEASNDIRKHQPDSPTKFILDFEVKKFVNIV